MERGDQVETEAVAPCTPDLDEYRWRGLERPLLSRRRRSRQSRERKEELETMDRRRREGRSLGGANVVVA